MSTAHLQISHADVIVINKSDLVSEEQLEAVEERVRSINALAQLRMTQHSEVSQLEGLVLDIHAYENVDATNLDFASKGHSHLDPKISTIAISLPSLAKAQVGSIDAWLRSVLWENILPGAEDPNSGWEIYRIKGRLVLEDGTVKMLQGVREIFDFLEGPPLYKDGVETVSSGGKIVIIGRNLGRPDITEAFSKSLNSAVTIKGA